MYGGVYSKNSKVDILNIVLNMENHIFAELCVCWFEQ